MELLSVHRVAFCLAGIKVRTQLSDNVRYWTWLQSAWVHMKDRLCPSWSVPPAAKRLCSPDTPHAAMPDRQVTLAVCHWYCWTMLGHSTERSSGCSHPSLVLTQTTCATAGCSAPGRRYRTQYPRRSAVSQRRTAQHLVLALLKTHRPGS